MRNKLQSVLPLIAALMLSNTTGVYAHNPGGKPDPMNASLEKLKGAEFEQSFLQQMIQHHRSGIEMAKLGKRSYIASRIAAVRRKDDLKAASGDRQDDRLAQELVQRFPERSRERSCRQRHEDAYVDVERKERLGLRQSVS